MTDVPDRWKLDYVTLWGKASNGYLLLSEENPKSFTQSTESPLIRHLSNLCTCAAHLRSFPICQSLSRAKSILIRTFAILLALPEGGNFWRIGWSVISLEKSSLTPDFNELMLPTTPPPPPSLFLLLLWSQFVILSSFGWSFAYISPSTLS